MNKISTKLAAYFTVAVLIMEGLLMLYLHDNIIDSRIEEEFQSILSRGTVTVMFSKIAIPIRPFTISPSWNRKRKLKL